MVVISVAEWHMGRFAGICSGVGISNKDLLRSMYNYLLPKEDLRSMNVDERQHRTGAIIRKPRRLHIFNYLCITMDN